MKLDPLTTAGAGEGGGNQDWEKTIMAVGGLAAPCVSQRTIICRTSYSAAWESWSCPGPGLWMSGTLAAQCAPPSLPW